MLLLSGFLKLFFYIANGKAEMKADLEHYLYNVQNYSESDIKKVKIHFDWFKTGEFHGEVIYNDDPIYRYFYTKNRNNEITLWTKIKVDNERRLKIDVKNLPPPQIDF